MSRKFMTTILIVLLVIFCSGLQFVQTDGVSMSPTQVDGDISLVCRPFNLKPGDIVTFITPEWQKWPESERLWCKRIVYIEGDKLFLQGDNTNDSYDSRHFGLVERSLIKKKQLFTIHMGK